MALGRADYSSTKLFLSHLAFTVKLQDYELYLYPDIDAYSKISLKSSHNVYYDVALNERLRH